MSDHPVNNTTIPAPALDPELWPEEGRKERKRPLQREWAVQRGVKFFVKRVVAVEHEFASHDRGRARSEMEHVWEAARGIRRDWLDTELLLDGGRTFRCELKAPGERPKKDGGQLRLIERFNRLGHPASWANSVKSYGEEAERLGVPLRTGWRVVAIHADELVAADIRKQEVKRDRPKSAVRLQKRATPSRIRRAHAAGLWKAPGI